MSSSWQELLENPQHETFLGLPWLFDKSLAHKVQWRAKLNYYLTTIDHKILQIQQQTFAVHPQTKLRLDNLLAGYSTQRALVAKLLPDLESQPDSIFLAIQDRVPPSQFVGKYMNNIFRDWVWGENEIQAALAAWLPLFPASAQGLKVVFLGAGACRLPYEIHKRLKPQFSVATDINPLLLKVADTIMRGEEIELVEFPSPVMQSDHVAIKHKIQTKLEGQENFHLVFADALNSPFKEKAFDIVATPWLIDILPLSFSEISLRINNTLKESGLWLNTGPLAYGGYENLESITPAELEAELATSGFQLEELTSVVAPYLQSPYSMQKRAETIVNFRAKKVAHCKRPKRLSLLPDFVTDTKKPILASTELKQVFATAHGDLQVLNLIDNTKSIHDIATLISSQTGVEAEKITANLISYFITLYERTKRN